MSRETGGRGPSCRGVENKLADKGSLGAKGLVCLRGCKDADMKMARKEWEVMGGLADHTVNVEY